MNPADFHRNFQQSYFGLRPDKVQEHLTPSEWAQLDFTSKDPLVPCTSPVFTASGVHCTVLGIFKFGDKIESRQFILKWKRDMDEDRAVMITKAPLIGMTQHEVTATYLRRAPIRSFNRGYNPRAVRADIPNPLIARDYIREDDAPSDYLTVWRVYNPVFYPFDEALRELESGNKMGVTLTRLLAVVCEERRKYPILVYRDRPVGIIQNGIPVLYATVSDDTREYIARKTKVDVKIKG